MLGNRWCIQPMEGWDGTPDGRPTDWTRRRWEHFGRSGAKLIWGGEAVAVRHDGRANPNQLCLTARIRSAKSPALRDVLIAAHREAAGQRRTTCSSACNSRTPGGSAKPNDNGRMEPRIAYHHPILDARFGIRPDDDAVVFSDDDLYRLMDDYVAAARLRPGRASTSWT